ncbi:tyrosinase cofactor [Streptomyces sp. E11-3]|uniref:apotyrosinase chaperone MelC1 n=1 Tax=Streptomyces sp. E11-3 TaxID=3110112 RepID=UPI00397F814C
MSAITRRQALGAAAGAAAAMAMAGYAQGTAQAADAQAHDTPGSFDEVYQGRRIQGAPSHHGSHGSHHGGYTVHIDGEELHVMRNTDGTWISVINHYEPRATPLGLARAAVVDLQGASLVPLSLV